MRIAILCNGRDLAVWQRRAVDAIRGGHDRLLFDWYIERRTPLAGIRRVLNRLPKLGS